VDAHCEIAIVGAGVVGCALAHALAQLPGISANGVLVLEAEAREGTGVSSRNSGVVHAGLYYTPSSRKARTCVAGNRMLWDWVAARGVAHRMTGKLVVATAADQEPQLEQLLANARASGANLSRVTLARARELEPALPESITAACWSPRSGIVDAHGLTRSLRVAAQAREVEFVCSAKLTAIEPQGSHGAGGFRLETTRGSIIAARVINAAGLHATAIAKLVGLERSLFPARGDYFRLRRHAPWQRLIYPVKPPGSASLGVHLTLELDGHCRLGPDLEWIDDPEDFSPARGEAKHARFLAATRRLLGACAAEDLVYDGCGIRPKLVGPGVDAADFELVEHPRGCWHLLGIESPGLTASLALADEVVRGLLDIPAASD
jgi:L-2-hydroxyglutarate oxidase LhgO